MRVPGPREALLQEALALGPWTSSPALFLTFIVMNTQGDKSASTMEVGKSGHIKVVAVLLSLIFADIVFPSRYLTSSVGLHLHV